MSKERLHKILARAGIASRRKCETMIREGLVTINGRLAQIGDQAEMGKDSIKVNGKLLVHLKAPTLYLAFYKPRGVISTLSDPENRPTLAEYLKKLTTRVYPVGRLDFNSEGLIILTNDGNFAEKLQKMNNLPRVYHAKVKGHPDSTTLGRLESGMRMEDRFVKPHSIRVVEDFANKTRIELVFLDSGVIDVKGYLERKGFLVDRLIRTAIGQVTLKDLVPGQYRILRESQAQAMVEHPELGLQKIKFENEKAAGLTPIREKRLQEAREKQEIKDARHKLRATPGSSATNSAPKARFRFKSTYIATPSKSPNYSPNLSKNKPKMSSESRFKSGRRIKKR